MTADYFNSLWLAAFGWALTDANGLKEWTAFVCDGKRNDKALKECLREYGERYATAKSDGKSNYRDVIPTLTEFRKYYFATMPERKLKWNGTGEVCKHCGGDGHVWGLVEQKGHEAEAPEHVMEIADERIPYVYYGVAGYDCPVCRAAAYTDPAYRQRVMRNCLPERVTAGDPSNPHDYDECGARIILVTLKARLVQAGLYKEPEIDPELRDALHTLFAGKGAPARVAATPGKFTDEELKSEERRVTDELAATFGPR